MAKYDVAKRIERADVKAIGERRQRVALAA